MSWKLWSLDLLCLLWVIVSISVTWCRHSLVSIANHHNVSADYISLWVIIHSTSTNIPLEHILWVWCNSCWTWVIVLQLCSTANYAQRETFVSYYIYLETCCFLAKLVRFNPIISENHRHHNYCFWFYSIWYFRLVKQVKCRFGRYQVQDLFSPPLWLVVPVLLPPPWYHLNLCSSGCGYWHH